MARLAAIAEGHRAMKVVPIPLKNIVPGDGVPEQIEVGLTLVLDWSDVLKGATKVALECGGKAEDGCEAYDYGKALYTVALTTMDAESDPKNPVPFFGLSPNATLDERVFHLRNHRLIGRDTVLYLAELQDWWQDECGAQGDGAKRKTPEEYAVMLAEVAEQGPLAFFKLSAASRYNLVLFGAEVLLSLRNNKSTSGVTST